MKALNCSSTRFTIFHSVTSSTYSLLFSFVTGLFVFNRECLIEDVGDVIFQRPCQVLMILFVHSFHILNLDLLPQHHLVESTNKEGVQETPMEDRKADHTPNEF